MAIEWSKDLELGIPEIDDQNLRFFEMFEALSEKIEHGKGDQAVGELLEFLDAYARDLFKYEEYLLEKSGYGATGEHIAKHRKFISELKAFNDRLDREGPTLELAIDIKKMLLLWLLMHVRKTDREFIGYLQECEAEARGDLNYSSGRLGEILVAEGIITEETLARALGEQGETKESLGKTLQEMGAVRADVINRVLAEQKWKTLMSKRLGEILLDFGLVTEAALNRALARQKETGKKLGVTLVEMGVITPKQIIEVQAIQKGMLKR